MKRNEYTFMAFIGAGPIQLTPGEEDGWNPANNPDCKCPPLGPDAKFSRPHPYWSEEQGINPSGADDCYGEDNCVNWEEGLLPFPGNPETQGHLFSGVLEVPEGQKTRFPDQHLLTGIWFKPPMPPQWEQNWVQNLEAEVDARPCSERMNGLRPEKEFQSSAGVGSDCTWKQQVMYVGETCPNTGVSGISWTGWCVDSRIDDPLYPAFQTPTTVAEVVNLQKFNSHIVYEGTPCANNGYENLYACVQYDPDDLEGRVSILTPVCDPVLEGSCTCYYRYLFNGSGIVPYGNRAAWQPSPQWNAWASTRDGPLDFNPIPTFHSGIAGCNFDESKHYTIASGTEPFWSDANCDWMYKIRERGTGCRWMGNANYPPDPNVSGCPTGPTVEIGETNLLLSCSGFIDWACCLGALTGNDPDDPAYCDALQSRGSLYTFNDEVCYGDGTGNVAGASGQSWMVNDYPAWSGGPPCSWLYDLQYYDRDTAGPSGTLQTGIAESALSTGCSDSFPY